MVYPRKRKFNFTDAELNIDCNVKTRTALRDLSKFKYFGYNKKKIEALRSKNQELANFPTDSELLAERIVITERKDNLFVELERAMRKMLVFVGLAMPIGSGKYRSYRKNIVSGLSVAKLIEGGFRIVRFSIKDLELLQAVGMDESLIAQIRFLSNELREAIEDQVDQDNERDIFKDERIELVNGIYSELVQLCNVGRNAWIDTNEAKYNDYILYDGPPKKKPDPIDITNEDDVETDMPDA